MVDLLLLPLCEIMLPGSVFGNIGNKELYNQMLGLLEADIEVDKAEVQEKYIKKYSREGFRINQRLKREQALADDLKTMLTEQKESQKENKVSILKSTWSQIQELVKWLSYEKYIDDQFEIEEICEALVRHLKGHTEPWKIRKKVLQDIIDNEGYDYYGCGDSMSDLLGVLCTTEEEYHEKADIMMESRIADYQEQAAEIYYKYGHDDEYISYLESNLRKSAEIYLKLIEYYNSHNLTDKAIEIANDAVDNCRDAKTTEIFIFLIKEAYKAGDKTGAAKLYRRAKQRKNVSVSRLEEALGINVSI